MYYGQTSVVGRMCKKCDSCVASASTFSLKAQGGYMEMIYFITLRTFSYITYSFFLSLKAICVFKSFIFHGFCKVWQFFSSPNCLTIVTYYVKCKWQFSKIYTHKYVQLSLFVKHFVRIRMKCHWQQIWMKIQEMLQKQALFLKNWLVEGF